MNLFREAIYGVRFFDEEHEEGRVERREEIVRCRDCMYITVDQSEHDFREPVWCNFHRMDVKPDGFCAWGERKDGDAR